MEARSIAGSRKMIAFCLTLLCLTGLRGMGSLSDEAFMIVASAALGGFFTANVMSNRTGSAAKPQAQDQNLG